MQAGTIRICSALTESGRTTTRKAHAAVSRAATTAMYLLSFPSMQAGTIRICSTLAESGRTTTRKAHAAASRVATTAISPGFYIKKENN